MLVPCFEKCVAMRELHWCHVLDSNRNINALFRGIINWHYTPIKAALVDLFEIIFLLFKLHRQIFFIKSCFFVSFRGIEGVFDTDVWSLDRSRQYFSSKISIAKSLYFLLFHFIFFSRCEMWYINSGKWKCGFVGTPTVVAWCCGYTPAFNTPWWPI